MPNMICGAFDANNFSDSKPVAASEKALVLRKSLREVLMAMTILDSV
jgi:hypothetical protein